MNRFLLIFLITVTTAYSQPKKDSVEHFKLKKLELRRDIFALNIPKRKNWVNDFEKLFSDEEKNNLNNIITKVEGETSFEIVIVTLDTNNVSSENFEAMSLKIAQTWAVGKHKKENGILIAISKGYRRLRIQNGNGIEKILTNNQTQNLIDNYFIPEFKKGNYYQGTLDGLNEIIKLLYKETTTNRR
ncbi:TPM domain-containing protein [Flavobacterium selenitireducens]|uniref:TPM domain-containing protein n=1 Tax=Flavobacterium selenitireducens TaxID=2722704 RepID=UPI00168B25B2|nr:TPM domain-containing protein [Flavobacterium selenitireducens]MBD3584023.1 TPM domain-containing protein [Flavobacterium selenitireducens]